MDFLVITVDAQMESGERQSAHFPVTEHGVFLFKRTQFGGAAILRTRFNPSTTSVVT